MATENNKFGQELNRYIGSSYNQYFTFTNSSAFYALAPSYLKQYYNTMVFMWDQWCSGWVLGFHSIERGLLPTMFASSYCDKLAQLIYGEGLIFESTGEKKVPNPSLDFISGEYDDEADVRGVVKDGINKSVKLGNSLLKINATSDHKLWVDAIPGNRFFVDLDSRGKIIKSRTYVSVYMSGVPSNNQQADTYGLMEERYWKEVDKLNVFKKVIGKEKLPYVVYKIYRITGPANVFDPNVNGNGLTYEDLPRSVQKRFRQEYASVMLNKEEKLPLANLGVYLFKHTKYLSNMPNVKLGESALARIINYLPQYDAIDCEVTTDIRVTRPKVVLPHQMGKGSGKGSVNELDALDPVVYDRVPNLSDKDQTPIVFAPAMRTQSLEEARLSIVKKCCMQTGVSVNSIESDITDGRGQVTATQISSEDSNTASWIQDKRQILIKPINDMITTILLYYGYKDTVRATFATPGTANVTVNTENIVKAVNADIMSEYQAVKERHPEWNETQIQAELDEIHKTSQTASNEVKNVTEEKVASTNSVVEESTI